jgi:hypothetical protein
MAAVHRSRDLFDGGDAEAAEFAVGREGALRVVSFDHTDAQTAKVRAQAYPGLRWLPVAGLDRHTPMIGLAMLNELKSPGIPAPEGVQDAVFRPISDFISAEKP